MHKDCDLITVMQQIRRSKNFLQTYLTREQKILMKYSANNIIDGKGGDDEDDGTSDKDEIITNNL